MKRKTATIRILKPNKLRLTTFKWVKIYLLLYQNPQFLIYCPFYATLS